MSRQIAVRPGPGAAMLLAALALILSLPVSLAFAALFTNREFVLQSQLLRFLAVAAPVAVALSYWLFRKHSISIRDGVARFSYTRYAMPRHVEFSKDDLLRSIYIDGLLSVDGRPRPLIEYELRSGASGWVPFTLYSRSVIREVIGAMLENGLHVENGPR